MTPPLSSLLGFHKHKQFLVTYNTQNLNGMSRAASPEEDADEADESEAPPEGSEVLDPNVGESLLSELFSDATEALEQPIPNPQITKAQRPTIDNSESVFEPPPPGKDSDSE